MSKRKKTKFNKLYIVIAIFSLIVYLYSNYNQPANSLQNDHTSLKDNLNVYFLDVGQADSILITNDNHNVLIDAGNNEDGPKLVNYLKSLNITHFDYIIGTHHHEDHIGGLDDTINNFDVDEIMLPDAYTTTKTFEDVLDAISNKNKEITIPKIGDTFNSGNAKFTVIYTDSNTKDLNNSSIVLKLVYGQNSFLLTGDATSVSEKKILNQDIKADVFKIGHHGSSYSTSEEFLTKVSPSYAIISVGANNNYNHPAPSTIKRLNNHGITIYKTSELGTILVTSDGTKLKITNFTTDTNG